MLAALACVVFGCATGLLELVVLGFLPGKRGPNKYGADPIRQPAGVVADVRA